MAFLRNTSTFDLDPIEVHIEKGQCRIGSTHYPMVGFGTYPLKGTVCTEAVEQAISSGYRILDTATRYRNFEAIAKALKGKKRSDFYVISKVWHGNQLPANLHKDLESTLEQLQMDYIDAYLVHWPNSEIPIEKTLGAMEQLRQDKKIRHIGLSNVTTHHLKRALQVGVPISWVQVEMHPFFYDATLLQYCKEHSIVLQAWAPLDRGRVGEDTILVNIGKKYGKNGAQVALRWIIQHSCIPLPGSKNERHIRDNSEVTNFMLSKEEMEEIDARAARGLRRRFEKEKMGFVDEFDFSYEQCWPKK
jgi:diketogulonate reductase-like aldo/keto reductase